jgi:hypothetical protein
MHQPLLLPHRFKVIGLIILIPSFIYWLIWTIETYDLDVLSSNRYNSYVEELLFTSLAVGLLLITFAREKTEDEYIMTLRLQSLQWAVLTNAALLLLANWVFYGDAFLSVMIYNMLTVLIIFVIRFHYVLYRKLPPSVNVLSFPPQFKKIGFLIVTPFIINYILMNTGRLDNIESEFLENWGLEILITGMTVGLIMMAFAREKSEDEFIASLRLRSLQWAVLLNYGLLLILNWKYYSLDFLTVLTYNMFTVLIIFVVWFNINLWRTSSSLIPE